MKRGCRLGESTLKQRLGVGVWILASPPLQSISIGCANPIPGLEGLKWPQGFQFHVTCRIRIGVHLHAAVIVGIRITLGAICLHQAHVIPADPQQRVGIRTDLVAGGAAPDHSQEGSGGADLIGGNSPLRVISRGESRILGNPKIDANRIAKLGNDPHAQIDGWTFELFVGGRDSKDRFEGVEHDPADGTNAESRVEGGGQHDATALDVGVAGQGIKRGWRWPIPVALWGWPSFIATKTAWGGPGKCEGGFTK